MTDGKPSDISKILIMICGTLVVLLGSELLLRAFSIDLWLMRKTLYYQCAFLPLHKVSSDAQRLYELVPNTSVRGILAVTHPKEKKYRNKIDVSINALGFRGKCFAASKRAGVFRIVIFGGSNTFGSSVCDEDAYPAQMQKIFDEEYPGKVEVWNAGICAYQMSQDVAYAESVIKKYNPDLLIFQETNRGRRAFFFNTTFRELQELFHKNNELFLENIQPLWRQNDRPSRKMQCFLLSAGSGIHRSLVSVSALYRTFCVGVYSCLGIFTYNGPLSPLAAKELPFWGYDGQRISNREFNLFTKRHNDKKMLLFFITDEARKINRDGVEMRENMGDFVLNTHGKSPEYQEKHPPSYVYTWYARELCNFLVQKEYVPPNSMGRQEPRPFPKS